MLRKVVVLAGLLSLFAFMLPAQDMNPGATKSDWEEINFEFNSAVLSDGFPSLLRLADLLHSNPTFHLKVEGHADRIGNAKANVKLAMERAERVRDFLVKYGASASQIEVSSEGSSQPKYPGAKEYYSRTDVARWMNRRVALTLTDGEGRIVGDQVPTPSGEAVKQDGSIGDVIKLLKQHIDDQEKCCADILARLDRIEKLLQPMADKMNGVDSRVGAVEKQVNTLPDKEAVKETVAESVNKAQEAARNPKFSLLGLNVGEDTTGHVSFTGKARFFAPFKKDNLAIQSEGEYMYFNTQREAQFDLGLVERYHRFQGGLFGSFKHVDMHGQDNGGNLGQVSAVLDYLFPNGRVGIFGTHGFMDQSVLSRRQAIINGVSDPNIINETYLQMVDQYGAQGSVGLWGPVYLEGNLGYLHAPHLGAKPGATARLVFPVNRMLAFTLEGGVNESLVTNSNDGRIVAGILFGNFLRPKDYLSSDTPVPMDIPRIRYEMLTRQIRKGHSPPVADAGADQINVASGVKTLDGSHSYSPDGDPLTYQWVQESGPSVNISNANQAVATFTAASAQTYIFRLTVTNPYNQSASARVRFSTVNDLKAQVLTFTASPTTINQGQTSTLTWTTQNATAVTIIGIGAVGPNGSIVVTPSQTTTYEIVASNSTSQDMANATVTVQQTAVQLTSCSASPATIDAGQTAAINFTAQNATNVSVSGIGTVTGNSFTVTPATTTAYTITAFGASGSTTCVVNVTVNSANSSAPVIASFSANPDTITSGQTSTLTWSVTGPAGTTVSLTGIGSVGLTGSSVVSPTTTTTYTLTAQGPTGAPVTATATVTVNSANSSAPVIASFSANPTTINSGQTSTLTWSVTGPAGTTVSLTGIGSVGMTGSSIVSPTTTTTYTLTAQGPTGAPVTATATVTVNSGGSVPVIVNFSANPSSISAGQSSTLGWTVTGPSGTTVTIDNGVGSVAMSGNFVVMPTSTTTYTLTAQAPGGTPVTAQATVTVGAAASLPNITFTANPNPSPGPGAPVTLTCTAPGSTSVVIDGFGGVNSAGQLVVNPTENETYVCTATGPGGSAAKSLTVVVTPVPDEPEF